MNWEDGTPFMTWWMATIGAQSTVPMAIADAAAIPFDWDNDRMERRCPVF
jgi:hypothetical protein